MKFPFLRGGSVPNDQPAVVDVRQQKTLTRGQLRRRARSTAALLAYHGVCAGSRVGLLAEESCRAVVAAHAVWGLGGVLVPLHRRETNVGLKRRVERLEPVLVLVGSEAQDRVSALDAFTTVGLDEVNGDVPPHERTKDTADDPACGDDRAALILFTSGTSGSPKAVVLSRGNLRSSARGSARRLGHVPTDGWLDPLPFYHMGGLAPVLRTGLSGGTLVLTDPDPDAMAHALSCTRVTGISVVPTLLHDTLRETTALEHPRLRFVLAGGAAMSEPLIDACQRRRIPLYPTYGMTETSSQVATAFPWEVFRDPTTVGRPLPGTTVTILDEDGEPLPPGETGEITVSGPTVMVGYQTENGRDASSVGPHGFHTGDRGYRDASGRLHVRGRITDRIVSGGENIDPEEVQSVLRDLPTVRDAAVVGIDHPRWGQQVAALLEPEASHTEDARTVQKECRKKLASYKCPRRIRWIDRLPRTASGTVNREAVRRLLTTQEDQPP